MQERDSSGTKKPLVVFAGRSNVGKSSTIRALTGVKLRVGKKPGSTRRERKVDLGPVMLVDIPGFGYMSGTSKTDIEKMKVDVIQQLEEWSEDIVLGVLVLDISIFREIAERWERRREIPIDVEFYTFLHELADNVLVVANKVDKVKKKDRHDELEFLRYKLIAAVPTVEPLIVPISASREQGIGELRAIMTEMIQATELGSPQW
ncbi:GTP-binding protein EngB [Candidatus Thorarchaeota archaeon]|jgi:GTP-binding protein EngB required for normal cell division|nr:MAG: GTP-binding protein EngB [Candidatus Thorarchaeota archaeon]